MDHLSDSDTSLHVIDWQSEDEWDVEHPADCPTVDLGGYWDHDCLLGRILRYEGLTDAPEAPGRYQAKAWAYQSTDPRIFGEWTSGIDLTAEASK